MKKLLFTTVLILTGLMLSAQETFFPTKKGTVLFYKTFDKKDKLTNTLRYTIKNVNINGKDMDITYLCELMDPKDQLVYKEEITILQKGDTLHVDMSNFINKAIFQQNGVIPAEIEISGNNMEIPLYLKSGDKLPDANIDMSMKLGFINMKVTAQITNRKMETIEDVTVNAGTFKAYKFTSDVSSTAMGIKMKTSNADWYAKGIGLIKTIAYDKNGKQQSQTELVEIIK
jgi:hypothetical protein